jgi:hypothetical protein
MPINNTNPNPNPNPNPKTTEYGVITSFKNKYFIIIIQYLNERIS